MAGKFDVRFDDREVKKLIDKLSIRVKKPKPLFETIGRYVMSATMLMFRGKRPDTGGVRGVKWDKLAQSTLKNKAAAKARGKAIEIDRPLVRTGKLRDSLARKSALTVSDRGLTYGTNVKSDGNFPYPGMHNVGSNNAGKNKNIKIPARRWLFLTKSDLQQILFTTKEWLEGRRIKMKAAK